MFKCVKDDLYYVHIIEGEGRVRDVTFSSIAPSVFSMLDLAEAPLFAAFAP